MDLVVNEQHGWQKTFVARNGITHVGSAPESDVLLPSPSTLPLHLQIFHSPEQPERFRVLNLGPATWFRRHGLRQTLATHTSAELGGDDELGLDVYRIVFKTTAAPALLRASPVMEVSLVFAEAVLRPDLASLGALTIKNTGSKRFCQFEVRLSGLPDDCFQIDPAPMLHPQAQEQMRILLFHRELAPPLGFQEIKVSISAPESYPGEEVVIRQGIYVLPFFNPQLELQDDLPARELVIEPIKIEVPAAPATTPEPASVWPIERLPAPASAANDAYWNQIGQENIHVLD